MRIYSASLIFWFEKYLDHMPLLSTSRTMSSCDDFVNYCSLEAKHYPWFPYCDVHLNVVEIEQSLDGTLTQLDSRKLQWKNYKPENPLPKQLIKLEAT